MGWTAEMCQATGVLSVLAAITAPTTAAATSTRMMARFTTQDDSRQQAPSPLLGTELSLAPSPLRGTELNWGTRLTWREGSPAISEGSEKPVIIEEMRTTDVALRLEYPTTAEVQTMKAFLASILTVLTMGVLAIAYGVL